MVQSFEGMKNGYKSGYQKTRYDFHEAETLGLRPEVSWPLRPSPIESISYSEFAAFALPRDGVIWDRIKENFAELIEMNDALREW